ncbi:SH3 domain-containing C40 family peptidase [Aureicoccus marinus]|uniref:SH3 domain-containing C40 family peptidase n=1 Tax=Aureicoccus marinus TaxID=754435 RepID=UPI0015E3ECA1|nr:SH3 domain-containing C40 family peptidase [Aureicoccus marinus]
MKVIEYRLEQLSFPKKPIKISTKTQTTFLKNSLLPWASSPDSLLAKLASFPGKELTYLEKYRADDNWYGEHKKPHNRQEREALIANADAGSFPNFVHKGLVVQHTDLRRLPTERPGFDQPKKAGEGYPFDYFQETALWANTPLQILHLSRDKQWGYVISPIYKGWVSMQAIALVDEEFISAWTTGHYARPLSDNVVLNPEGSLFAIKAKMGMLLPYSELDKQADSLEVFMAASTENKQARLLKVRVAKKEVAMGDYPFEEKTLKPLVSALLGRPYGWGGALENRDCSSMIRDLMSTYQIWLPRDSGDQMEMGHHYDLPDTADQKLELIEKEAVPFLTILRKKGHNMLYVGKSPEGEPLIFHAIWALKSSVPHEELGNYLDQYPLEGMHQADDGEFKGRIVIGQSVITSVHLGQDEQNRTRSQLDQMYAMTLLQPN